MTEESADTFATAPPDAARPIKFAHTAHTRHDMMIHSVLSHES